MTLKKPKGFDAMSRSEKAAVVREMYDGRYGSVMQVDIAHALGYTRQYVSELLNDPDGVRMAERRRALQGVCEKCGGPTSGMASGYAKEPRICIECYRGVASRNKKWTRERIIAAIQEWNDIYGSPPASTQWLRKVEGSNGTKNSRRWPAVGTVQNEFGSWADGLRAAGFEPKPPFMTTPEWQKWIQPKFTKEQVVEYVREYYRQHGRAPTSYEWRHSDPEGKRPTYSWAHTHFGSWAALMRAADVPVPARGRRPSRPKPTPPPQMIGQRPNFAPCTCPACVAERAAT